MKNIFAPTFLRFTLLSILAGVLLSFITGFQAENAAIAQGSTQTVKFTGVIIGGENSDPIPNAYIFIPKAGRGTVTNNYGYFSLSVLPGDSVIISSIGFKQKYHIIPQKTGQAYSVIIDLMEEVTTLSAVTIYPYPTEKIFKETFLALQLPDEQERENMRKNLDPEQLNRMMLQRGMSANENFRYYTNQQVNSIANRNFNPTSNFLNPFAWAQFIKSIKRGDLKKKN